MEKAAPESIPILLKKCTRLVDRHIDQLLKRHSIARSQYRVLYFVQRLGAPTQKELIDALGVKGPTLTRIIDALVHKGWLTRAREGDDKRVKKISLTAAGAHKFGETPDPARALHSMLQKQLRPEDARKLEKLLSELINYLEA